jgi:gliding motility-associated transport system ATP-binding protein
MILAEHLTKRFGPFTAIDDVSFSVKRGEVMGFLGPNGAGKSTTMRILAGVFPPTSGRAVVAGYDLQTDSLRARRVVGYFPERVSLYLDLTVREYLRYVCRLKEVPAAERRRSIEEAMASCGVDKVAGRLVGTLSKGYRQRVGIAQAIVGDPRVLILDEPTSGLDPEQVAEIRTLIRRLRGDRTVILSTHILSEVEATCDRVIIINQGRILAVDTPENLNQRLRHESEVYLEIAGPEWEVTALLTAMPGIVEVQRHSSGEGPVRLTVSTARGIDLRAEIAAAVTGAGWGLRELRPVTLSLETIFLTLVSRRDEADQSA